MLEVGRETRRRHAEGRHALAFEALPPAVLGLPPRLAVEALGEALQWLATQVQRLGPEQLQQLGGRGGGNGGAGGGYKQASKAVKLTGKASRRPLRRWST